MVTQFCFNRPATALPDLFRHPVVVKIAEKHKKSSAQVLLKYLNELGIAVIPKSVNSERIHANFQVRIQSCFGLYRFSSLDFS